MGSLDEPGNDGELYLLAVSGSREAAEMLINRHHALLVAYVGAKTNVVGMAEDAVADAWLQFFSHLKKAQIDPKQSLRKPESVRFWLYRTALNSMRSRFRHSSRQQELSRKVSSEARSMGTLSYEPDELDRLENDERQRAIRDAFTLLGDACRELLTLLSTDPPMSYSEVSELLGKPIGSIGPTRKRCLQQLRYQLGVLQ